MKERDKEREREAGLQTPNRELVASPSSLSPGVSYSHGKNENSIAVYCKVKIICLTEKCIVVQPWLVQYLITLRILDNIVQLNISSTHITFNISCAMFLKLNI